MVSVTGSCRWWWELRWRTIRWFTVAEFCASGCSHCKLIVFQWVLIFLILCPLCQILLLRVYINQEKTEMYPRWLPTYISGFNASYIPLKTSFQCWTTFCTACCTGPLFYPRWRVQRAGRPRRPPPPAGRGPRAVQPGSRTPHTTSLGVGGFWVGCCGKGWCVTPPKYFHWKQTGEFINTRFFCRVCALLHTDSKVQHSRNSVQFREKLCPSQY